jgi:molybdopterin converting factor small subunit
MDWTRLGVRVHAERMLYGQTYNEAASDSPTNPIALGNTTTRPEALGAEGTNSILFYNFLCIITASGYYFWTRHHVNTLFDDANSWLTKACSARLQVAANVNDEQRSLETLCDELFEFTDAGSNAATGDAEVNTPYKFLMKHIDPDFARKVYKDPKLLEKLNANGLKELFDSTSRPAPWTVLKLKTGKSLSHAFLAKAVQLAQRKRRNSILADDFKNNSGNIINSPSVKKCFSEFEELYGGIDMGQLTPFGTANPSSKKTPPRKMNHLRRAVTKYLENFHSAAAHGDFTSLDDFCSFFLKSFTVENLCGGHAPHKLSDLADLLELHLIDKTGNKNKELSDDSVATTVNQLNKLLGKLGKNLWLRLLDEPLISNGKGEKVTLQQRFDELSGTIPTAPRDPLQALCDRFFKRFPRPASITDCDDLLASRTYATPYEFLKENISGELADESFVLETNLSESEFLKLLVKNSIVNNPLKLTTLAMEDPDQWKAFLRLAIEWAKVSPHEKQLNNLRRETNAAISEKLIQSKESLKESLREYFNEFYKTFAAKLKESPLVDFFEASGETPTLLYEAMFNCFLAQYAEFLKNSNLNPAEALFTSFPASSGAMRIFFFNADVFAKELQLAIKKDSKYDRLKLKDEARNVIEIENAMESIYDLMEKFQSGLLEYVAKSKGEGSPRKIIEDAARELLDAAGENGEKSAAVKLEELQSAYEEALKKFNQITAAKAQGN